MNRPGMVKAMARHVIKNWRNHPDAEFDSFAAVYDQLIPRYAAHEIGKFKPVDGVRQRERLIYDAIEYAEQHPSEFDDIPIWDSE